MVSYRWFSPRAGAVTRGGIDYLHALSKIWLYGNFQSDPLEISRLKAMLQHARLERHRVNDLADARSLVQRSSHLHFVFRWDCCHTFGDFKGYRESLRDEIYACATPEQRKVVDAFQLSEFIAMNVRTGKDFVPRASGLPGYHITELDWFIRALGVVRGRYGDMPCVIVSDGGPKQLAPLLALQQVQLVQTPSAVADLLILSKASVLLGTGNSSFSAWGSYLGGMDTFSSPETPFDRFRILDGATNEQKVDIL